MATASDFAERLEIFFGNASDALCHVYARLRGFDGERDCRIAGTLTGPTCPYAETLPASYDWVDLGPGNSILAQATLPEPSFWTPEMPHLYRAEARLCRGSEMLARVERPFGIRRLGADRRSLLFDAKRWVLRGVRARPAWPVNLPEWRACDTSLVIHNPNDDLCREASRIGVLIVAELDAAEVTEIRRLSRWPAVGVVILPSGPAVDLGGLAHNLLLAERFAPGQSIAPARWAQIAVCDASPTEEFAGRIAACRAAVFATRPAEELSSVAEGRALCDRLQRDLGLSGELAGYIV